MSAPYDAVVIGAGPGGRAVARALAAEERRVAMVERELVGGECPFWACIPTKTLLRPVEARSLDGHVAGLGAPGIDWSEVAAYRDYMTSNLDDTAKARAHEEMGIEIVRGEGRAAGGGVVEVDGRRLETERIVIATGTTSAVPDIDGLDEVDHWTNREATALADVPRSAIVLGGGPVGIELAQMLRGFGCDVTVVQSSDRVLNREDPRVSALLADALADAGIELRLSSQASAVERSDAGVRLRLASGDRLEAERLIVAVGRRPRVDDLGLEELGVQVERRGIRIDERCRAAEGVWAVGDVTGVAPFTHVASYQGRIAAADILGRAARADYRAVPRVVFSTPEVAAVGLTPAQAADEGIDTATAEVELGDLDRTETYGRELTGGIGVVADRGRGVLVGAWAVGPLASEWIHSFALAVKAEIAIDVLLDTVAQFPTFSESLLESVRALDL